MTELYRMFKTRITLDSSNNTLRVYDGTTTADITIPAGNYYFDTLANEIATQITAALAPTVTAAIVPYLSDSYGENVAVSFSGTANIQILWTHANTTLDGTLLGFQLDTSLGTVLFNDSGVVSVWIPNEAPSVEELTETKAQVAHTIARDGSVSSVSRASATVDAWMTAYEYLRDDRSTLENNSSLKNWFAKCHTLGSVFRLTDYDGVESAFYSATTIDDYVLKSDTIRFQRQSAGLELWSVSFDYWVQK